jgi:serine/threonine protein kinase
LHRLDLIHGDINPTNIMFDNDGRPIIIDFDICARKGEEARGGTFGWMDDPDFWTTAVEDIDIRALYRVAIFIHQNFTLDDLDLPPDYDGVDDDFALIEQWILERIDCFKPWLAKKGENIADPL